MSPLLECLGPQQCWQKPILMIFFVKVFPISFGRIRELTSFSRRRPALRRGMDSGLGFLPSVMLGGY